MNLRMIFGVTLDAKLHARPLFAFLFFSAIIFSGLSVALFTSEASALVLDKIIPYYGQSFYDRVKNNQRDQKLIEEMRWVLSQKHLRRSGQLDDVVTHCDRLSADCYSHSPIGYGPARKAIMGELHLVNGQNGFAIEEVYCQRDFTRRDFRDGISPGPGVTPNSSIINVEHTWPQSRFNKLMDTVAQKSDLHHLFPTDSEMNSARGNMKFGEVDRPSRTLPCSTSKLGTNAQSRGERFEPPAPHRGNVARALFYFSVRYQLPIDKDEEYFLRKWHQEDPVDSFEAERNDHIQRIQGNRNPFIDFPELVGEISDF